MRQVILCKYGEIVLKGLNRSRFEADLIKNVRRRLKPLGEFRLDSRQSTLFVEPMSEDIDYDETIDRLKKVYGIAKICPAFATEKSLDAIYATARECLGDELQSAKTFKVVAKRADKRFPLDSMQIMSELGGMILEGYPGISVDVKNPELTVICEIRDDAAYVHGTPIEGAGGIPVGTSGRALLLLSGGIDSPVAGAMMAKRGVIISAIHFQSPPYTSERALIKVERLAAKMTEHCGQITLFTVPFTEIQEAIRDNCPEELFTLIMRRLMMEIAQRVAEGYGFQALVTGESIGQVASQTMSALVTTDAVCRIPVFRPCICLDKKEIVDISYKIGTFDISIEPYEDCCTVFTPKHPKTQPTLDEVQKAQAMFDFEPLIEKAVNGISSKTFKAYTDYDF
ncbi:MAG TPA: tRNA 4-thiouridine(8) synthase ThiI [Candidatus Faeciplasma pullistercoris]|uniref:Probable tRNA sulfurtransferase n=1 Tax=Candidatus Faeciplasma pullistercoris TaxID=2840800 RepID=A0A9D1GT06_9FIRM|nr:tRNA 4-thiouridine(8) synthase ThiI [Candidatus Faeciplasma pullistercoris]